MARLARSGEQGGVAGEVGRDLRHSPASRLPRGIMKPALHEISFDGVVLARGFWLDVLEITTLDGRCMHYVGRTGDKPSGIGQ